MPRNNMPESAAIDRLGWKGYVGCEYRPRITTAAGLGWIKALLG